MTPEESYRYATEKGGSDSLRAICCESPIYSYYYALWVDKNPRDDTRTGACKDPYHAYRYALRVDKCPNEETRSGDCREISKWAYLYARDVDKGYHKETRRYCYKSHGYYLLYLLTILKCSYYKEIKIINGIKRI